MRWRSAATWIAGARSGLRYLIAFPMRFWNNEWR
jgi:hypothetical protein